MKVVPPFKRRQKVVCIRLSEERDYNGRVVHMSQCKKGVAYTIDGCMWYHGFGWLVEITGEFHAAKDFRAVTKSK